MYIPQELVEQLSKLKSYTVISFLFKYLNKDLNKKVLFKKRTIPFLSIMPSLFN